MIKLKNAYHGTEIRVTDHVAEQIRSFGGDIRQAVAYGYISDATARRIRKALCGAANCACGVVR